MLKRYHEDNIFFITPVGAPPTGARQTYYLCLLLSR